jgi:transposase, IS30 family
MTTKYKQLIRDERVSIATLHNLGISMRQIALTLGIDPSTVSREIKRNKSQESGIYNASSAQKLSQQRRTQTNKNQLTKIKRGSNLWKYIVDKMTIDNWSPQQIAGRMKIDWDNLHKPGCLEPLEYTVSHETIYEWIYSLAPNKDSNDNKDKKYDPYYKLDLELKNKLTLTLRYNKGKYRRRHGTRQRRQECEEMKKNRIDKRPAIVETRKRIGDWEGDTIVGGEKTQHILTHVDRRSGYLLADKLDRATALETQLKTISRFRLLPEEKKHTITYDNGVQFSLHQGTEQKSGIHIFFAYPYHSWERGTNENTNGLLRQYFPKKTPFNNITQEDIDQVVNLINNRPRKRLNYLTPHEVFELGMTL